MFMACGGATDTQFTENSEKNGQFPYLVREWDRKVVVPVDAVSCSDHPSLGNERAAAGDPLGQQALFDDGGLEGRWW